MRHKGALVATVVSIALALVGGIAGNYIYDSGKPWVGLAAVIVTGFLIVATIVITRRQTDSAGDDLRGLAEAVRSQWSREQGRRRDNDPRPIPVGWRALDGELVDHRENIGRGRNRKRPNPMRTRGDVTTIVPDYRRIPSGRLVVLGPAGAGKTTLALRFVLEVLEDRASGDPVPVLINLNRWLESPHSFDDWVTLEIASAYDIPNARALVAGRAVIAVLDGFDEVARNARPSLIRALNASSLPFLLTSRFGDYADTVQESDVVTSAAVIRLEPLSLTAIAKYLPLTAPIRVDGAERSTKWDPILARLRSSASDPAAANLLAALSTPLMVSLARTVYSDNRHRDPAELLDEERFGSPAAVEEYLLAAFLPSSYEGAVADHSGRIRRRMWTVEQVRPWLAFLATEMGRDNDLKWWWLSWTPQPSNALRLVRLLVTLGLSAAFWMVMLSGQSRAALVEVAGGDAWPIGLLVGLVIGQFVGIAGLPLYPRVLTRGFVPRFIWSAFPPVALLAIAGNVGSLALSYSSLTPEQQNLWQTRLLSAFLLLVAGVMLFAWGRTFERGMSTLTTVLRGGELFDLGGAARARDLFRLDRRQALILMALIGSLSGAGIGLLVHSLTSPRPGVSSSLITALCAGLVVAVVVGLKCTFWGRWVWVVCLARPLAGRLPWRFWTFLEDAQDRGVMRQSGVTYQFRHARIHAAIAPAEVSDRWRRTRSAAGMGGEEVP